MYERSAIATWLKKRQEAGQPAKSPVTNELMGKRLFAAPQVRNTIESMIQSGVLVGDITNGWNKRLKEELAASDLRRKAEAGDSEAQESLAFCYENGSFGFVRDAEKAFEWFKRGADNNKVACATEDYRISKEACLRSSHTYQLQYYFRCV